VTAPPLNSFLLARLTPLWTEHMKDGFERMNEQAGINNPLTIDDPSVMKAVEGRKIQGLKVNNLDNKFCCYIQPHLDELIGTVKSGTVVNICTGCYYNTKAKMAQKGSMQAKMLPEIVWESMNKA
jgi:hypothetical protein